MATRKTTKLMSGFRSFQTADLRDDRRMAEYIEGLERMVMLMARDVESLQTQSQPRAQSTVGGAAAPATTAASAPSSSFSLTEADLQLIRRELEAGGIVELNLTNLQGIGSENVDVRFRVVTSHPDPFDSSYDTYILSSGGSYSIWQIDRDVNPPVAVQIGLTANHALLSATHSDTLAATAVLGDIIYANGTPAWQRLAGNTVAGKRWLQQTGTGAVSAAPVWAQIASSDLSNATALLTIVGTYSVTGRTTALGTTAVASGLTAGLHILIVDLEVTTNGTGGTIELNINITDRVGSYTYSGITDVTGATGGADATINGRRRVILPFYAAGASAANVSTTFNGITGTPDYSVDAACVKLG